MQADLVGFGGLPGQVKPVGALRHGAHGILPMEAGHEVAAGIAGDGHIQLAHQVHHILPEAQLVRRGMAGLVDAGIHRAAQVLDERAVDALVNVGDHIVFVQDNLCLFHVGAPFEYLIMIFCFCFLHTESS